MNYALHIIQEEPDAWRWVIVELDGETVHPNSYSDSDYGTYANALNAGTLALAAADGQPYENEAADPVGDVDCVCEATHDAPVATEKDAWKFPKSHS